MHKSPHMFVHILIENTLVQQKMGKNSLMVPCCQNPEYRCTGPDYRLHSRSSAFAQGHGASVSVLGCLKRGGEEEENELVQTAFWLFSGYPSKTC